MGRSQTDKAISHERIVKLAAQRFREAGVDGISVAHLMQEVGMTHGGFYRHFPSRDDLVAEAIEYALKDGAQVIDQIALNQPETALHTIIHAYLSQTHQTEVGYGCAVVALATDVSRSFERVRQAYTEQVRHYIDVLTQLQPHNPAARQRAILTLCALVGAVSIARAVNDDALAQDILQLTKAGLYEQNN